MNNMYQDVKLMASKQLQQEKNKHCITGLQVSSMLFHKRSSTHTVTLICSYVAGLYHAPLRVLGFAGWIVVHVALVELCMVDIRFLYNLEHQ